MIFLRVDSNEVIATGHLMRCLVIANKLRIIGEECVFVVSDSKSFEIIEKWGFNYICLNSEWDKIDDELDSFIKLIKAYNVKKVIIDSYYISEKYLSTLKKYVKLIYLDDINKFKYPVNMIINYSDTYKRFNYDDIYKDEDIVFLSGYQYVPLRDEFDGIEVCIREDIKEVIFTVGGSDNLNITNMFIEEIAKLETNKDIIFNIVVGRVNKNISLINKIVEGLQNVKVFSNISNMSDLIRKCDLAITAGGTTILEMCACKIPTIGISIADNQREGMAVLREKEAIIYAGDALEDKYKVINTINYNIELLKDSVEVRKRLSTNMGNILDGKGASRIASEIHKL
ncbi:MAG: UDP-2,4-diacetamido-2,4,6-trideoxy-beta-L-altropyranose hydrolase [Clostridium sp.]